MFRKLSWLLAALAVSAQAQVKPESVLVPSLDGTELTAWLYKPAGAPKGAVIAMHGCGGLYAARQRILNPRHQVMADMLVGQGIAVLFPDSLTARGETELCSQKIGTRKIDQTQRRFDALGALKWVNQQPWRGSAKVALLGWSHGGSAVLAAIDTLHPAVLSVPDRFAAAIAFYPGCTASERSGAQPNTELALMLGAKDDWTPPEPCVRWGRRVGAEVNVYADSYHGFDAPNGVVRLRTDVPNGINPGQGVHVGPNPAARERANARVLAVLERAFRP